MVSLIPHCLENDSNFRSTFSLSVSALYASVGASIISRNSYVVSVTLTALTEPSEATSKSTSAAASFLSSLELSSGESRRISKKQDECSLGGEG